MAGLVGSDEDNLRDAGAMETGWIAVVLTYATFAVVQWIGLSRDWLRFAE